jgi:hypothetical protein
MKAAVGRRRYRGSGERAACKMGLEGIVSKRLGSRYRSGRTPDWLKFKNPQAPAVRREAEEDWGRAGQGDDPLRKSRETRPRRGATQSCVREGL